MQKLRSEIPFGSNKFKWDYKTVNLADEVDEFTTTDQMSRTKICLSAYKTSVYARSNLNSNFTDAILM